MKIPREPAKSGAEVDVIGKWRRVYCYLARPHVASRIKRQIRRRERKSLNREGVDE